LAINKHVDQATALVGKPLIAVIESGFQSKQRKGLFQKCIADEIYWLLDDVFGPNVPW